MHQCRHHAIRIEFHISGVVLVALQREQMLLDRLALFLERDPHLLGAYRIDVVIKLQHVFLLACFLRSRLLHAASFARSCGWPKSTGVPLGMIMVGFTLAME